MFWIPQETTAATCTTAAIETEECNRCPVLGTATQTGRTTLGHDFNDWTLITPVTETTDGEEKRVCQRTDCTVTETHILYATGTAGFAFTLTNNNTAYSVSKGTAVAASIIIPAVHNGLPVTMVASNRFRDYTVLTSITIPGSVTSIGSYAFDGCSGLTSVTIQGKITSANFASLSPFPGDLRDKYLAANGGPGTYTRPSGSSDTWTRQP